MEQQVFLLLLGMLSAVQGWTTDFCNGYPCPKFDVKQQNGEFDKREYVSTRWITTKADSSSTFDLIDAHWKLEAYCKDATVTLNTRPVLITKNSTGTFLSWFVADDEVVLPKDNSGVIKEEKHPAAIVYVKVFSDRVTQENAKDNEEKLHEALVDAGISFEHHRSSGAGYNSLLDLHQHNEVWMYGVTA